MDESDVIVSSTEIIKDRLYFATLRGDYKPKPTRNSKYFSIEGEIVYENYYFDFGPYHLCHLYQFCNKLNEELDNNPTKKIVFYTSDTETLRLNAAYLIGSYQVIYLKADPEVIVKQLTEGTTWGLLNFRDASMGPPMFDITLTDVLKGIKVAHDAGFFDFDNFDEEEYLHYEKVENGDLNWIIPEKMLAFSGPHHESRLDRGYPLHSPEHYHDYFKRNNVTTVIRLNKRSYDARQFTRRGFAHIDLIFADGSTPPESVVVRFLRVARRARGAVAVHCRAGLGRTGTLIACYMMKHHGFGAREAIAWLRVCRPGSVIGYQQRFLECQESLLREEYARSRRLAGPGAGGAGAGVAAPRPIYGARRPPVSLTTILNAKDGNQRLDNANDTDCENNVSSPAPRRAPAPPAAPPARARLASPADRPALRGYAAKTATFPPTRAAAAAAKNAKTQLTAKNSFHAPKTSLLPMRKTSLKHAAEPVTATLSALTENCHLNGKNRIDSKAVAARKKIQPPLVNQPLRKKPIKSNLPVRTLHKSNQDLSAETQRFSRKRDKSATPEPMDCAGAATDDCEDPANSQGNKLYKIKAMRKKCPSPSVAKKEGVKTRSASCVPTVKKK